MPRPLFLLLAAIVPLLLYARTVTFDFVRADDLDLIAGNQAFLSDLSNVPRAFTRSYFEVEGDLIQQKTYYRPVAIASFMLDAARGGVDPSTYHLTNIVLHALVTCLILVMAVTWGARPVAALAGGLLFAVHPVNAQAVAWIAGRNDLLMAVFGLLSLLTWSTASAGTAAAHVICFGLAVFSKETGLLFIAIALLYHMLIARAPLTRAQTIALGLDAVIVAVWAVLRSRALAGMPPELSADTFQIVATNAPQLLVHLRKILIPWPLNVAPGVQDLDLLLAAVVLVLLGVLATRYLANRLTAFVATWVLLFLVPTLTVAGLPAYEHRAYVPLIGVVIVLALAHPIARNPGGRTRTSDRSRWALRVGTRELSAALAVLTVFAGLTYQRLDVFRNPFTYWTDAARDPQFGPIAHVNLGQLYEAEGRPAEARREYARALERDPNTPKAHNNLGVVFMKIDEPARALQHFEEETRRHPWNADAWFNLGLFEEMRGDVAAARRHYERAIAENPAYSPAYEKLGLTPERQPRARSSRQ
jgi:hypothetical protein